MEAAAAAVAMKDQSSSSVEGNDTNRSRSKLRYPIRSGGPKNKDDVSSRSPASKSGRSVSSVSKSVSALNFSSKEKSAKPPRTRRLSIPTKSAISPVPRPAVTVTPISETRMKRSTNGLEKTVTPASDVSKSGNQRRFSVLYSASYWLSQIKLSESAAKHSISLGFFKLALESGCEPLQRMRDELKSYARRHILSDLGEPVKELLRSYNITEDLEQLQVSETISQVPKEGTQSLDEGIHHSTSITGPRNLKPKSLNSESFQASSGAKSTKESSQKRTPIDKNKGSSKTSSTNLKSVTTIGGANIQKKSERLSKQQAEKEKPKLKNDGKSSAVEKDLVDPVIDDKKTQEDKENMDAEQIEGHELD